MPGGRRFDHMSVTEWIDALRPRRRRRRTSVPCASRPCSTSSVAQPTRPPRSTSCTCSARTTARTAAPSRTASRSSTAQTRSGTSTAATTSSSPASWTGSRMACCISASGWWLSGRGRGGGYRCSFDCAGATRDVTADHVVLALPFTLLRSVDLSRVADRAAAPQGHQRGTAGQQLEVLPAVLRTGVERRAARPGTASTMAWSKAAGTRRTTSRARRASWPRCPAGAAPWTGAAGTAWPAIPVRRRTA